ncbi:MAG: Maf-like protein YhdE [Gammaproteobacteria bacterium]|nr:Maf-like protein YhdE [Gammaproteobacteria bacterium]
MSPCAPRIYLASQSPRRRELLLQIGVSHAPLDVVVDESWDGEEPPRAHVTRLALEKARRGWAEVATSRPLPVLAADTAVVLDDAILGKAEQTHEAVAMLKRLSGRSHWVLSGVALVDLQGEERSVVNMSRVVFRALSAEEIRAYCDTGEPLGKAGGYAIQGGAAAFIERLEGSYSGVMGLPLYETAALLRAAAVAV